MKYDLGKVAFAPLALLLWAGCTGKLGSSGTPGMPGMPGMPGQTGGAGNTGPQPPGGPSNSSTDPGRVVLRRLTKTEYNNTLRDLLGTTAGLPDSLALDSASGGFANEAALLTVTDAHIDQYNKVAAAAITELLSGARRSSLVTCNIATEKEVCARKVLQAFLPRAWRRQVTDADVEALMTSLYAKEKTAGGTDEDALGLVLRASLLSPYFLYLVEIDPEPTSLKPRLLNGYEVASRLSYFMWSSLPDETLFRAAQNNELATEEQLLAQATRMLADPKAQALTSTFGSDWLDLGRLHAAAPDAKLYTGFSEAIRAAMQQETELLLRDLFTGALALDGLLLSDRTYLNDQLAAYYGLPAPHSTQPVKVMLAPAANRFGLLTHGSMMASYSHPLETAPVLRGQFILEHLLCRSVPAPPPNIPPEPAASAGVSRKERLRVHREATCAACHVLMDPLGLAFENYDAAGAYRTTDNGAAIDPSGDLGDGRTFSGPRELMNLLIADPAVPKCFAKNLLAFAVGRSFDETTTDQLVVDGAAAAYQGGARTFAKLVETVVRSPSFRSRRGDPSTKVGGP